MNWRDRANCRDYPLAWWFPKAGYHNARTTRKAFYLCDTCPVCEQCLAEVMELRPSLDVAGIRGGLTAKERREQRRELHVPDIG